MEEIKQLIEKTLSFFDLDQLEININEEEGSLRINLRLDKAGFLIGKDGAHLKDLEYIFQALIRKQTSNEKRIYLDINNYRSSQEERLKEIAKDTARKVLLSKKPVRLSGFNSYERRIIHMELATNPNLATESEGEKEDRSLIVKIYP